MERNIWWWNWGWKEKSEVELSFSLSLFRPGKRVCKIVHFLLLKRRNGKKKKTVAVVVGGLKEKERRSEKEEKKERNRRNWRERDGKKDLALMISFLFFSLPSFHVGSEMIPDPDLTYDCRSVERREWKKGNVFEMGWKRKREKVREREKDGVKEKFESRRELETGIPYKLTSQFT